jgi:hypothetical protein
MSLRDRIPAILPIFRENTIISSVVDAIGDEFDTFETDTETVQDSLFLETAEGQSLDLIAEELSIIARRRGRSDEQFRQFLQGLVPAFDGRGTSGDVRLAVAAGVSFDESVVELLEDFSNREYQVRLLDWIPHSSGTTRLLADIADPVAVDLVEPVILVGDDGTVAFVGEATANQRIIRVGLSSGNLGPLSRQGFTLSDQ